MNTTHNEQTKLLATGINNIAVAFIVIGVVTPVTAVSFGIAVAPAPSLATAFFAGVWFCAGAGLHILARRALRSLKS
ncbi:hypothetical protein ASG40_12015 [Methylobacterium sp. Leaf399]|uniref:hypothetical protein n=1 Tax=unclassified Methylobacterium TaxID=2615210 RepID=UPI0006F3F928|nr:MULTISPECIES: hypothetical protein [unclassified Methylobacterium]KQP50508.1 hypothetical protein ASF39_12510 [Methylobacterium sp. Leaf108]KQT08593.1 hypothetical protein ASG40_12015 [Methylobacterium sp. Leaf399]